MPLETSQTRGLVLPKTDSRNHAYSLKTRSETLELGEKPISPKAHSLSKQRLQPKNRVSLIGASEFQTLISNRLLAKFDYSDQNSLGLFVCDESLQKVIFGARLRFSAGGLNSKDRRISKIRLAEPKK